MNNTLFKIIADLTSRLYFSRKEYSEPLYHFLVRIGWQGLFKEALAHLCFLFASKNCFVLPRVVRFETSSLCNLKCLMCPQPQKMKRPKKNMDFDLFRKVIDLNPQIKEVELFNWGEPLMNPKISEFVKYASHKNILSRFVTNATLLNPDKSVELIEAGLDQIYFSLDNIDSEYEKIRNYSFTQVVNNISAFIDIARKKGKTIRTGVNIVRSQYNTDGIDQAVKMFKKMDVDIVSVEDSQYEKTEVRRTSRCFEPYRNMTILSNGDIVPCCVDYDGILSMGSAWHEPELTKTFNNSAFKNLRRSFRSKNDMHNICAQCSYRSVIIGA